jgi:hypothetical protein
MPVSLKINGVRVLPGRPTNFGVLPYFSGVELVSTADPNVVVTLANVNSFGDTLIAGVPDGVAPGDYKIRVVNPDGQNNDVTNAGSKEVIFKVLNSSTKWSRAQRMPNLADPGSLPALHGRMGMSSVVDPDTGKIYFFAGNDARQDYNHPTRTLISYSETSAWQDHSANVPGTLNARMYHAAAWKNGATQADDRMFVYGGMTWNCLGAPPAACPNQLTPSPLDDLWMYAPSTNTWTAITITGAKQQLLLHKMHWNPADNSLYIYGGTDLATYSKKLYKLVVNEGTASATWSEVTFTGGPANGMLAPDMISDATNGRFYIVGGIEAIVGQPFNSKFWSYHVASNTWTELTVTGTRIPRAYSAHGFDPANRKIYIFGGGTSGAGNASQSNQLEIGVLDSLSSPTSINFSSEAINPTPTRYAHASAWSNGRFYAYGGKGNAGTVLLYDPNSPADPLEAGHSYYTDIWQYIP